LTYWPRPGKEPWLTSQRFDAFKHGSRQSRCGKDLHLRYLRLAGVWNVR
jgi:hypothetical protein